MTTAHEYQMRCEAWRRRPDQEAFGRLLAEAGVFRSRKELALQLEVPEAVILRWERGRVRPHPMLQRQVVDELTRIAREEMAKGRKHAQMRQALYAFGRKLRMQRSSSADERTRTLSAYLRRLATDTHPLRWARQKVVSLFHR